MEPKKVFRLPVEQFEQLLKDHPIPVVQKFVDHERIKSDHGVKIQKYVSFEFCEQKDEQLMSEK